MKQLRTECLWGIDAGKDPEMARIARLNMLLHKDGGSRIYFADALDKSLRIDRGLPLPSRLDMEELKRELLDTELSFSCVLTNPPFSMTYLITTQAKRNLSSRSGIGGVLSAT